MSSPDYFSYTLPPERIAQRPLPRGGSRLLVAGESGAQDRTIADFPGLLGSGDVLVLNRSKVFPARFFTSYPDSPKEIEVLLVRRVPETPGQRWEALARPMRALALGSELPLSPHLLAWICGRTEDDQRIILDISTVDTELRFDQVLEAEGSMPIPPYIRDGLADDADRTEYQTIFAEVQGSIAAPTAGLHFTEALLDEIRARGVEIVYVTHHVGPASFQPVREQAEGVNQDAPWSSHQMLAEASSVELEAVSAIRRAKAAGKAVWVVGTTSVRALESAARSGELRPTNGFVQTDLFITPGFNFRVVDRLLTNFHQPRTTHLLLVAAFAGESVIESSYQHALAGEYRFLSYGDAMLLERARTEG